MTRPLRLQYEDACYHVTSRAPRREKLFNHPADKEHFISIIENVCQRYGMICYAYCLMDNHYHMFLRTQFPNLSKAMHSIHCSYKYKLPGAIFQGRLKSILIDSDSYAVQLVQIADLFDMSYSGVSHSVWRFEFRFSFFIPANLGIPVVQGRKK